MAHQHITLTAKFRSDLILLLAAVIWGFAFVAQRAGMAYVGPFTYNGVRFTLGVLVLMPLLIRNWKQGQPLFFPSAKFSRGKIVLGALATGVLLTGGVAFQQIGLQTTTAGKAGFITGLYVVLVPLAGILLGHRSSPAIWVGAALSLAGLYFLSVQGRFSLAQGDILVVCCAIIFTFHVLMIAWLSPLMNSYLLAVIQFAVCAVINLVIALSTETVFSGKILEAWLPIAYGGVLSVGVAYTLQVVAQKTAHPGYASIILSLEAVFAVAGGWILLDEHLTGRMLAGCVLMLTGFLFTSLRLRS